MDQKHSVPPGPPALEVDIRDPGSQTRPETLSNGCAPPSPFPSACTIEPDGGARRDRPVLSCFVRATSSVLVSRGGRSMLRQSRVYLAAHTSPPRTTA